MNAAPTNDPEEAESVPDDQFERDVWANVRRLDERINNQTYSVDLHSKKHAEHYEHTIALARRVKALEDAAVSAPVSTEDTDLREQVAETLHRGCQECRNAEAVECSWARHLYENAARRVHDEVVRPLLEAKDAEIGQLRTEVLQAGRFIDAYRIRSADERERVEQERDAALADAAKWSQAAQAAGDHCRQVEQERDRLAAEIERLRGELDLSKRERVAAVILGSREEACPKPFALYRHEDVTGADHLVMTHDESGTELAEWEPLRRSKVEHQNGPLTEVVEAPAGQAGAS